jgi:hypothetical protein
MREAIFVLVVLLILMGLTAFRYRRQLRTGYRIWTMMKEMRSAQVEPDSEGGSLPGIAGPLVICAKCRKWVPESEAMKLGATTYYCSSDCMEKLVETR